MNNRLQQFLAAENISQSVLADTLGVARASVSHILAGRNKPGFDFIESISRHYPNINLEWLITGKGKMYKSEMPDSAPVPAPAPIPTPAPAPVPQKTFEKPAPPVTESRQEEDLAAASTSSIASTKNAQCVKTQKSISKIVVLYNDGSYQEFK